MRTKIVNGYLISGDADAATAVAINDPTDAHDFSRDPDVNDNAFTRAAGWAYEPPED